jgi:hypothetical protein
MMMHGLANPKFKEKTKHVTGCLVVVVQRLDSISLEVFAVTELNKMFSGRQPRQNWKVHRPFRD